MAKDYLASLQGQRFALVDAIRGIAACAVVARHLFYNETMGPRLETVLPTLLQTLSIWGAAGVYAFFIISGFVIAHSLRDNPLTRAGIGNFAVRRQLRLDPPYWATIALIILTGAPSFSVLKSLGARDFIANIFYLQYIAGAPSVVNVAWTLCMEIQFYIAFVGLLWLCRNRRNPRAQHNATPAAVALIMASGLVCLALTHLYFFKAYFVSYWHYFALGVVVYWGLRGAIQTRWFAIYLGLFALGTVAANWHGINEFGTLHSLSFTGMAVGLATALLLCYAGLRGTLATWGNARFLQYLGRVSYSLYLIHPLIIEWAYRVDGHLPKTPALALIYWLVTPPICLGFAHLLYVWVERPSVGWAAQLKGADKAILVSSAP